MGRSTSKQVNHDDNAKFVWLPYGRTLLMYQIRLANHNDTNITFPLSEIDKLLQSAAKQVDADTLFIACKQAILSLCGHADECNCFDQRGWNVELFKLFIKHKIFSNFNFLVAVP